MSALNLESLPPGLFSEVEAAVWPVMKDKVGLLLWHLYDADKNVRPVSWLPVSLGTWGLVAFFLTKYFGTEESLTPAAAQGTTT